MGWELKAAPPSPGPLPAADRRRGTDGQPAAPSLRPHREAAAQAATRLQHPLPVQGPRPAANVRGECVRPLHPHSHSQCTAQVSERPLGVLPPVALWVQPCPDPSLWGRREEEGCRLGVERPAWLPPPPPAPQAQASASQVITPLAPPSDEGSRDPCAPGAAAQPPGLTPSSPACPVCLGPRHSTSLGILRAPGWGDGRAQDGKQVCVPFLDSPCLFLDLAL